MRIYMRKHPYLLDSLFIMSTSENGCLKCSLSLIICVIEITIIYMCLQYTCYSMRYPFIWQLTVNYFVREALLYISTDKHQNEWYNNHCPYRETHNKKETALSKQSPKSLNERLFGAFSKLSVVDFIFGYFNHVPFGSQQWTMA